MKTFKQFLSEGRFESVTLGDLMHEACQPYWNRAGKNVLYRGMRDLKGEAHPISFFDHGENIRTVYHVASVRKDRRPTTMNKRLSVIIDKWFDKEFGIKARSQTLFCSGSKGSRTATQYGHNTCIVVPIGEFKYVWSPEVEDLYDVFATSSGFRFIGDEIDEKNVFELLDNLGYQTTDFENAAAGKQEIMIECDEYIVLPYGHGRGGVTYPTRSQIKAGLGIED